MLNAQPQAFGVLLRRYRLAANLTQEALAERASLSTRAISDLERGVNRGPQPATLELLTEALGLSAEERACLEASARRGDALIAPVRDRRLAPRQRTPDGDDAVGAPPPATISPASAPPARMPARARRATVLTLAVVIGLVVLLGATAAPTKALQLAHLGGFETHPGSAAPTPVRGGVWTVDLLGDPGSLLPNGGGIGYDANVLMDQALYLPLFYGDTKGGIHPGAAREIPTQRNGGVNADATIWTFRLRPGLVWTDGVPEDARDVDFTWRLWSNTDFDGDFPLTPSGTPVGIQAIRSATVSSDHLSITFTLKQPNATFPLLWVDGVQAPLPAHRFSAMAPAQVPRAPDALFPSVTSGPFQMVESQPGDHYTLTRNRRYYQAGKGLPYLDKLVFHVAASDTAVQRDFQEGSADSTELARDLPLDAYQHIPEVALVIAPASAAFEALFFNFHNVVLSTNPEVREAIARAIDHDALIQGPLRRLATPLCTDHPSALHPGYQPNAQCPAFGQAAANKVLDDAGWVRGPDGVRARGGQRLEFEYSSTSAGGWREAVEALIQHDLLAIGIKLDIDNYPGRQFFTSILPTGKPSPPTGAVAGRFDIAEYGWIYGYNPDDSILLACDQRWPVGNNMGSYCNPGLDELFRQELVTTDAGRRQTIFDREHEIYVTDFPFIVLFSPLKVSVARKGTHNYAPSPIVGATVNVWEWWCDGGRC